MVKIRDATEDLCQMVDIYAEKSGNQYDHLTLEEFLIQMGAGEVALGTAKVWANAMLGCEAREVSALYFLDYCKRGGGLMHMRSDWKDGGQYLRIRKGKSQKILQI
jgi:monoamine oxidase